MNFSNDTYQTQSNQNSTADDEGGLILHTCRDVTIPPMPFGIGIGSIGIVRCWYWWVLVLVLLDCSNHANCPATTIEDQNDQNLTNSEEQYGHDSRDCIGQVQDSGIIPHLIGPSIIRTGQDAFSSNFSDAICKNLDEKTNVPRGSFNQPKCVKDQPSEDRRLPENVLAVQNHHGTWSALKGHPKIKEDGTLETRWETCLRELFEEVSIRYQGSEIHQRINKENICHLLHLKKDNYIQYRVDSNLDIGKKIRIIGLFIVSVNENEVKFSLKDTKENKVVEWLKFDGIIQNNPGSRRDIYFTLRPFIKYLNEHPIH
ncbi:unnamed protein product [Rotaria magnacalcarata]|uniref:Nudix hydrolase domain-containing protein n=1 Tax=Rotaria magnacalcarata TaxID=392030 RepID=A0A815WLS3_9BILA|nr:unnamed protein product [Rotaria magnacalcarata]CAF1603729.1 unnamed protein product [Rotaria magnacalcarata]